MQLEVKNPGTKTDIEANGLGAAVVLKMAALVADNNAYHIQEVAKAGLKDLIIGRVPKVVIQELEA